MCLQIKALLSVPDSGSALRHNGNTSHNIGYARISTQDQTLALQQDALAKVFCDRIFTDTASGPRPTAPGRRRP